MTDTEGYVDQAVVGLAEPQPMYKALRESTPVFRAPQAVVLTRLADIDMALKHTDLFSSNMDAVDLGNLRPLIPLQIDPPEHAKYRRIRHPRSAVRSAGDGRCEPRVTELVNQMVDRFANRGECDFHAEFAVPLPWLVGKRPAEERSAEAVGAITLHAYAYAEVVLRDRPELPVQEQIDKLAAYIRPGPCDGELQGGVWIPPNAVRVALRLTRMWLE
jgi:cytochrome P450